MPSLDPISRPSSTSTQNSSLHHSASLPQLPGLSALGAIASLASSSSNSPQLRYVQEGFCSGIRFNVSSGVGYRRIKEDAFGHTLGTSYKTLTRASGRWYFGDSHVPRTPTTEITIEYSRWCCKFSSPEVRGWYHTLCIWRGNDNQHTFRMSMSNFRMILPSPLFLGVLVHMIMSVSNGQVEADIKPGRST